MGQSVCGSVCLWVSLSLSFYLHEKSLPSTTVSLIIHFITQDTHGHTHLEVNKPSPSPCSPGGVRWGHCCLQVESLRILLAVELPLRDGLEDEEERRSVLGLLCGEPPSVPFTHTGLAAARLRSTSTRSSSAT